MTRPPWSLLLLQRFEGVRGIYEAIHEAILPLAAKPWAPPSTTTAPGPPPAKFFFLAIRPHGANPGEDFPANLCTGRRAFQPRPQITDYSHLLAPPSIRERFFLACLAVPCTSPTIPAHTIAAAVAARPHEASAVVPDHPAERKTISKFWLGFTKESL